MTLEKIIQKLKNNAESENYHSMISMYQTIADIVTRRANADVAKLVMRDILKCNGFI